MSSRGIPNHLAHCWNMANSAMKQSHHSYSGIPIQWKFRMEFEDLFCSRTHWTSSQQAKGLEPVHWSKHGLCFMTSMVFLNDRPGPLSMSGLKNTTSHNCMLLHKVNSQLHHHQETQKSLPASKEEVEQGSASGRVSVLAARLRSWAMASLVISICFQSNSFAIP